MPLHRTLPTRKTTTARPRPRFSVPRGLIAGTLAAAALVWGPYALIPGASMLSALVQSGIYLGLLLLTICSRRAKVLLVRTLQRSTLNPLMRLLLAIGVNPFGLAILKPAATPPARSAGSRSATAVRATRLDHRRARHPRRLIRNIRHDPRVRVRLRVGLRYRWVNGIATVRPDDDPLARQRQIIAWHPLRALNAINVRVLGADLLTVHVQLQLNHAQAADHGRAARTAAIQPNTPVLTSAENSPD